MKTASILFLLMTFSFQSFSANESFSIFWAASNENHCSRMCDAFVKQAGGYCMTLGYAGGNAASCNCDEKSTPRKSYGNLSCYGELGTDKFAKLIQVPMFTKERCSEVSELFHQKSSEYCEVRGFEQTRVATSVHCDEPRGLAFAVTVCETPLADAIKKEE